MTESERGSAAATIEPSGSPISRVLVPVGSSDSHLRAVSVCARLAEHIRSGLDVITVRVPGSSTLPPQHPVAPTRIVERVGSIVSAVAREADDSLTLVCMASSGRGALGHEFRSSVSEDLLLEHPGPLLLIGPHVIDWRPQGVLAVALDGTTAAEAVLPVAINLANQAGLTLFLVEVLSPDANRLVGDSSESGYLHQVAQRIVGADRPVGWDVLHDTSAEHALIGLSHRADVAAIAIVTPASASNRHPLGSTVYRLIHHGSCPVLAWHHARVDNAPRLVATDSGAPVVSTVASGHNTTAFKVCLEPGQELATHSVPIEVTLVVLEGEPIIAVGPVEGVGKVGDVLIVPAGVDHGLRAGPGRAVVVGVRTVAQ